MITEAKLQFCQAGIKIIEYICNVNDRHADTSKVLMILDWLKYFNKTLAWVFLGVCIYYRI